MKRLKIWLFTVNLTFLLTLNLFLVIAGVLAVVGGLGWLGSALGLVDWTRLLRPEAVMVVIYCVSIMVGISTVVMIRHVILKPVQGMVSAMQRLAAGDFDVRMECRGWMCPLELRDFTAAFNKAAEELGGSELLRRDFINSFSHEFKTPITSLGGFADLLLEDEEMPVEERREYLQIISKESKRLAGLASSVLALSRVEAQTILTGVAPFDLTEQLRQAVIMVERKWTKKAVQIQLDDEECVYTGSEALMKEVWMNLLDNAVKFSPDSGIVEVRLRQLRAETVVTIRDHGPGIDEDTQKRIFDQFYQGDTSHKTEGNGIGLAMVKKILALHGAEAAVDSVPGQGSVFTVSLPN